MFKLPELPYDYNALEPYIDTQTMKLHHDKHHQGYVDNLNKALEGHTDLEKKSIKDLLQNLNNVPQDIRTKVRNNAGGHANHTMFWKIMCPPSEFKEPSGKLLEAIDKTFGSLDEFKKLFEEKALSRFGSGWVWLVSKNGKLDIVDTANQDTPWIEGDDGVLGLDIWEHAYYLKYQNKRGDYAKAWWNVVNWPHVEHHFELTLK